MIEILKTDAAFPFFNKLMDRNKMNLVEVVDTIKELMNVLHTTSTDVRPQLNGSSQSFVAEQLGLSKSLISQYLAISNIRSNSVKQLLVISHASISKSYYIARIRGKTSQDIESMQLEEISRISHTNNALVHKLKTAQMILKNVAGSKSVRFDEVDFKDPVDASKTMMNKIDECISIITPNTQKVKTLSEQLGYCNFLITHNQESKCVCGSQIDLRQIQQQKKSIIDEILSINNQVMSEKKYTSLLISAKKEIETAISSNT